MSGQSPEQILALRKIKDQIMVVFTDAGFAFIQPDILQPADVFLDRSGEEIRSRTYLFATPDGRELALRPDLTVPACRYHLSRPADPARPARYCYCGPAFRFRAGRAGYDRLGEFEQAGIECFGAGHRESADAEVLALALKTMAATGLDGYTVRIGDLALFHALLDTIDMPARWRRRLRLRFWRPRAFRELLQILTGERARERTSLSPLLDELTDNDVHGLVAEKIDAGGLTLTGGRSIDDIAERLAEKAADRSARPLSAADCGLIDNYLALRGAPGDVLDELNRIAAARGGQMTAAVERFALRLEAMSARGLDTGAMEFSAVFGRNLEYYTGFVFQIEAGGAGEGTRAVAGGGRYDRLLSDIGGCAPIPAVGCAIDVERLLAVVEAAR